MRAGERVTMHAGGLLRLREPSVAQCPLTVFSWPGRQEMDLLPLQLGTLAAQIPGKDSDPQQKDQQQGYGQGR